MHISDLRDMRQQGQILYQKGDFQAAVDAFTEALESTTDVMTILDCRAAAYAKLAQYNLAVRDARHMIRKDKNDGRGYLRLAKVLLLDAKPDKALAIYAHGLKTLPNGDQQRELIRQLHEKLQYKLSANCIDPFSVLPPEVVVAILRHSSFRELAAILRVSKKWNRFLSSVHSLWMRIELLDARRKVHWTSVRSYIQRSKAKLTGAVLANIAIPSAQKVLQLLSRCPNIEHLELHNTFHASDIYGLFKNSKSLKTLIIPASISIPMEYALGLLEALPLIETFEIYNIKASQPLTLHWLEVSRTLRRIAIGSEATSIAQSSGSSAFPVISDAPGLSLISSLEEIRLSGNVAVLLCNFILSNHSAFPRLRRLELSLLTLPNLDLPSSIEYLRINAVGCQDIQSSAVVYGKYPRLSTLILSNLPWMTIENLEMILQHTETPLRVLCINFCLRMTGSGLAALMAKSDKLDSLEELSIANVPQVDDKRISDLIRRMTKLKVLDISYTAITGCTIKNIADSCLPADIDTATFSRIYVKGCEKLSLDAVAYGRAKGIEIFT